MQVHQHVTTSARWMMVYIACTSTSSTSLLNMQLEFPNLQFLVQFFPLAVMCWWACVAEFHKRKIAVTPYVKAWKQRFLIPLAKICSSLLLCHSSKERCVQDIGFYARNCICYQNHLCLNYDSDRFLQVWSFGKMDLVWNTVAGGQCFVPSHEQVILLFSLSN